jgi:hypothetical protein
MVASSAIRVRSPSPRVRSPPARSIRGIEVTQVGIVRKLPPRAHWLPVLLTLPLPLPVDNHLVSPPATTPRSAADEPAPTAAAIVALDLITGHTRIVSLRIEAKPAGIEARATLPDSIVTAPVVALAPALPIVTPAIAASSVVHRPTIVERGPVAITPALLDSGSVVRAGAVSQTLPGLASTAVVRAQTVTSTREETIKDETRFIRF